MPDQPTSVVERIARVLAGQRLSSNAEGSNPSAGDEVDGAWRSHVDDAVAILKSLRDPPDGIAAAGDRQTWHAMIEAALQGN